MTVLKNAVMLMD